MARKIRVFIEGLSQHVLLKSLNGLTLFKDKVDYETFLTIIQESNLKYDIEIHAYVLMPNYFEFLATPKSKDDLPRFMQSLGRKYVAFYNKKYNRTGTIWDSRYKSSLVESSLYLFEVMKYIEKLPLTNNLVADLESYKYSSVCKNLFNEVDKLVVYHSLYKNLGYTQVDRIRKYTEMFNASTDMKTIDFIVESLHKQSITASKSFIKNLEEQVGLKLIPNNRGRPKKQNNTDKGKKMYKKLVVLDKEKHKELKLNPLEDLSFAKETAFIPVVASEVIHVGSTFPVVFSSGENTTLISLVSLGGDSLAINSEGKWITSYLPSYLRKYPFSLGSTEEKPEQKVVLIDEESKLFSNSKGKKIFKKSGEQSEVLEHAMEFLKSHEEQITITKNVAKIIADSGILEDREISVGEGEEKKVLVNGFKVVDREKLNALSDDILADWVRKGIITMIDAHIKSLDNIQTLFNIAHQRQS